jgi:hypothetical protein
MGFCWKILLPLSLVQVLANGFVLEYEASYWWLAVTSGAGAVALVAIIIRLAFRRSTETGLVGAYRTQLQVPAQ